jgi:predicted RNA-binding Zn ribbon-like protein
MCYVCLMTSGRNSRAKGSKQTFVFWAGRLCLDFANTVHDPGSREGKLRGWTDVDDFLNAASRARGQLSDAALLDRDPKTVGDAQSRQRAFEEGLRLREAIRFIASDVEGKRPPRSSAVSVVNKLLREDEGWSALVGNAKEGWQLTHQPRRDTALRRLVPIACSAAQLIADTSVLGRVRKCANPECPMLFYDDSRTRRRRWCSMAICGNRAKVAAHHRRQTKSEHSE